MCRRMRKNLLHLLMPFHCCCCIRTVRNVMFTLLVCMAIVRIVLYVGSVFSIQLLDGTIAIIIPLPMCALYIGCTLELAIVLRAALDRHAHTLVLNIIHIVERQ
jgi:hypothetical protein